MRPVQCQYAVEKRGEPPNTCKALVNRVDRLVEHEELRGINKGGDSTEPPRHLVRRLDWLELRAPARPAARGAKNRAEEGRRRRAEERAGPLGGARPPEPAEV